MAAIEAIDCVVRIAGDASARVSAGVPGSPGGIPVVANGGTLWIDPLVQLQPGLGQPSVVNTGSFALRPVSATWSSEAQLGQVLEIRTRVPAGGFAFLAVGLASPLAATPIGSLGIDLQSPYAFLQPLPPGPSGTASWSVLVPASLPRGAAFAAQAAVAAGAVLELSAPSAFVLL